jgi:hypothetical protein
MLVKRGNPFFLEETVRTLMETGALAGERGAYRLTPEEKRLLQAASVIGKHVPFALLAAIAEQPEEALRRGLGHLQEAEFLYETQLFPDLEHTFKHALTHDVAYAGLLGERRRDLHAAVAAAIERLHADRLVEHVERLPAPGRHQDVHALGQSRGGHLLRADARRAPAIAGESRGDRRVPRHPLRSPQCAPPAR